MAKTRSSKAKVAAIDANLQRTTNDARARRSRRKIASLHIK
jgi:hypothetical protein